jgi:hypothetical protein
MVYLDDAEFHQMVEARKAKQMTASPQLRLTAGAAPIKLLP